MSVVEPSAEVAAPALSGRNRGAGRAAETDAEALGKRTLAKHWLAGEPLGHRLRRYPLLWAAVALILGGKFGAAMVPKGSELLWAYWGLSGAMLIGAGVLTALRTRRAAGVCGLMALVGLGAGHGARTYRAAGDSLALFASRKTQPIAIRGVLETAAVWRPNPNHRPEDPESRPWRTQWEIQIESVLDGDQWRRVDAKSTLSTGGRIEAFLPGDAVEVYGSFRAIQAPTNPGVFDLAKHYRRQGKYVFLAADSLQQISSIGKRSGYPWQRLRGRLIRHMDGTLRRWVIYEQAPLAAALVFGQREQVDWEDQQELMATGTLHMLAISGLHVEIVAWGVLLFCTWVTHDDRMRLIGLIAVCGLYAALADGKPPVMRAAVLVAAFEIARWRGRRSRLSNLLGLAAIVLFLANAANVDNVGVHLSFLAVAAIGVFGASENTRGAGARSALQTLMEENLGGWARMVKLIQTRLFGMLQLSFWVWLITCPLIWAHFHVVAPIAILLNVLVAWPLAISLLAGIATGTLGWIAPLGWCTGAVCGCGLSLIGWLVGLGQTVPFGHLWLPSPPAWWSVTFYAWLLVWLIAFGRGRRRLLAAGLLAWLAFGIGLFATGPRGFSGNAKLLATAGQRQPLKVTFLDVGHGTSVMIELPDGHVWLYDAGHLGAAGRSHQEIAAALWAVNTARIDTLVLSHADSDHYNATQGLAERFHIDRVVSTSSFWQSADRKVVQLREFLKQQDVVTQTWSTGDGGEQDGVRWEVLHPRLGVHPETDNASSLCLLLEYRDHRILLPGDLEGSGLIDLSRLPKRPCQVLMAPHHGSLTLDPTMLLEWCRPEWIVISGNHRANRRAVMQKYLVPGAKLGITFRDGAIQFRLDVEGEPTVWHWREDAWHEF